VRVVDESVKIIYTRWIILFPSSWPRSVVKVLAPGGLTYNLWKSEPRLHAEIVVTAPSFCSAKLWNQFDHDGAHAARHRAGPVLQSTVATTGSAWRLYSTWRWDRSDVVLVSGGLGPTVDDVTARRSPTPPGGRLSSARTCSTRSPRASLVWPGDDGEQPPPGLTCRRGPA